MFLAFVAASFVVAYEAAMHFTGTAIDGPFQLYNALRRIGAGYRPGVDFQFFHGLGIPYVHYWLYSLFGYGLKGSELARELLASTMYPVVYLVVFRAFTRSWTRAVALSAAAMAASFLLHLAAMLFAVNGMLSLRSALPTLLPAALLLQQRVPRRPLIVGSMIGFGLFVSTEQGLAAVLALSLVSVLAILTRGERRGRSIELTITLGIAIVVFVLALVAVGGFGGMRGALRYNFRLVPMDQYWYFGAPPNVFIPSWSAGFRMLVRTPPIGFPIALCICAVAWYCWSLARTRDERWARRQFALAFLSVYGLISCASLLGVFTPVYAQPCWRVVLIIAVLEVSRAAAHFDVKSGKRPLLGISRLEVAGTLGLAGYAFLSIDLLPTTIALSLPHIVRDHAFGNERFSMGGIWPEALRDGQAVVNTHRATDGKPPVIWSTYAGWLEARNGVFNPYADYIIHALGPEGRQAYVDSLRATRPQIVQTVRPSYTFYEAWLENMTWAFYDEVLDWYAVESMSPWSVFWKRRATKAD